MHGYITGHTSLEDENEELSLSYALGPVFIEVVVGYKFDGRPAVLGPALGEEAASSCTGRASLERLEGHIAARPVQQNVSNVRYGLYNVLRACGLVCGPANDMIHFPVTAKDANRDTAL